MPRPPKFEGSDLSKGHGGDIPISATAIETQNVLQNTEEVTHLELLKREYRDFLPTIYYEMFYADLSEKAPLNAELVEPSELYSLPSDTRNSGDYTLHLETQSVDFSAAGGDFLEVEAGATKKETILRASPEMYWLPGIEYARWLAAHPDAAPAAFKKGPSFILPGSVICSQPDGWFFIEARWNIDEHRFKFHPIPMNRSLSAGGRVAVLFKKL